MRKKAVKLGTNFRSRLAIEYADNGLLPFEKYKFIDPDVWAQFFKKKTTPKSVVYICLTCFLYYMYLVA